MLFWLFACADPNASKEAHTCPWASLDAEELSWSDAEIGAPVVTTLTLTDDCTGDGDISVWLRVDGDAFGATLPGGTVAPGESVAISVAYAPDDAVPDNGTLTVFTDDPDHSYFSVPLSGTPAE